MVSLKPLREQVVVITGASSGIGLETARMAARQGAKVVLAARNAGALRQLAAEISGQGGHALAVPTDVGHEAEVDHLADAAVREFGGFDTWVNYAGVSIFGRSVDVSTEDMRRMFDRFQEEGMTAAAGAGEAVEAILGRKRRRYRDFAAETAARWKG